MQEREKYYHLVKNRPQDLDDLFDDLKVLGKREIGSILKWRGKVLHQLHLAAQKEERAVEKLEQPQGQPEEDSEAELQKALIQNKRREIKHIKERQDKHGELMIKSQLATQQHDQDQNNFGEAIDDVFGSDIEALEYEPEPEAQLETNSQKQAKFASYNMKDLEKNLEEIYEARKQVKEEKQEKIREAKQERKDRREQRYQHKEAKLKSRKIGADPDLV